MNLQAKAVRILFLASLAAPMAYDANAADEHWPTLGAAAHVANAASAPILAAAKAGGRTVAVGDHGVILLSDDGVHFRQAAQVPTRALLTTVQFVDARRGFAAGHDGVVLGTQDGGENWTLLRSTPGVEQPVMSLYFDSVEHGVAVGLFGWAIETHDGGHSWSDLRVGSGDDSDRHLFHLFVSPKGTWLIAAEAGTVYRSVDSGKSWQALATGDEGSLWHGLALADGMLLVCGMRGHLYRSTDDGKTWQAVTSGTTQSLTSMAQMPDGTVIVVGMNGTVLRSKDSGMTFSFSQREQGEPLTDVLADGTSPLLLSMTGPLAKVAP